MRVARHVAVGVATHGREPELGHRRLTEHDRAGGAQARHRDGVRAGQPTLQAIGAHARREAARVDLFLDRDRHTFELAARVASGDALRRIARGDQRLLVIVTAQGTHGGRARGERAGVRERSRHDVDRICRAAPIVFGKALHRVRPTCCTLEAELELERCALVTSARRERRVGKRQRSALFLAECAQRVDPELRAK